MRNSPVLDDKATTLKVDKGGKDEDNSSSIHFRSGIGLTDEKSVSILYLLKKD